MRRRGVHLDCDVCGRSMFLKNLDGYPFGGWQRDEKLKLDICPVCVKKHEQLIEAGMTWEEVIKVREKKTWHGLMLPS